MALVPERRRTAAETVYLACKRDITVLRHAPGAALTEQGLAELYGTSRVPVREACRRLQQEGLLDAVPYKGYFVTRVSLGEIRDCFELRQVLEVHAVTSALERARAADFAALEGLADTAYTHHDWESYAAFLQCNNDFHLRVAALAGNARLVATLRDLLGSMQRFFFLGLDVADFADEMRGEHRELVQRLCAADRDGAIASVTRQIARSRERILAGLARRHFDLPLD